MTKSFVSGIAQSAGSCSGLTMHESIAAKTVETSSISTLNLKSTYARIAIGTHQESLELKCPWLFASSVHL